MSGDELENILNKDGYISNFKIFSLCSDYQINEAADLIKKLLDENKIDGFIKDGVVYYKHKSGLLC